MFMVYNQTNLSLLNVKLFFNDSDHFTDPTAPYNFEIVSSANSTVIMRHVFYLNNAIKFKDLLLMQATLKLQSEDASFITTNNFSQLQNLN